MDALLGWSGFVGGNLDRQHAFGARFNSRSIAESAGAAFDTVVCAAAPGSMFEANRLPDRDAARIDTLIGHLSRIQAQRFVLISTIAVLADFAGQDDEDSRSFQTVAPYGRHRRRLEEFCAGRFTPCLIVRLPALFGSGLGKNFLFDLLNPMPTLLERERLAELRDRLPAPLSAGLDRLYTPRPELGLFAIDRAALAASGQRAAYDAAVTDLGLSAVRFTHPASRFQFYDLSRLWSDIGTAQEHGLDVIHLAPEPVFAGQVFRSALGSEMAPSEARIHREDMWTRHAPLWGRANPYLATAAEVLAAVTGFLAGERHAP